MPELEPVEQETMAETPSAKRDSSHHRLYVLALVLILAFAAFLRFRGLNWDENTHLHPDERFLTMVESSMQLPASVGDYFNTAESLMNPHNIGYGFFVYGTFPLFLVRYVAEWVGQTGYDNVQLVGRAISASADLLTIFLVYLLGRRLYGEKQGLLAAFFAAVTALLIQHAHFFVVEPILTLFVTAGLYFAVRIFQDGTYLDYAGFGAALGLAVATKISIAPLAVLAVVAASGRMLASGKGETSFRDNLIGLSFAAVLSILLFRIFQPYAFEGPHFWNVFPNPAWIANISEIAAQNGGNTDAPFALQWANRTPVWFAWKNMVLWGMGLPLGLAAWAGWGGALLESFRSQWKKHFLLLFWVGAYFLWQSTSFTPAMRYQLPVYPPLLLLASWGLWALWDWAKLMKGRWAQPVRLVAGAFLGITTLGAFLWGTAFSGIYAREVTRVEATRWIYEHIPAVMNLVVETDDGPLLENVPMSEEFTLMSGAPHIAAFTSYSSGDAVELLFAHALEEAHDVPGGLLTAAVLDDPNAVEPLAVATYNTADGRLDGGGLRLSLDQTVTLEEGTVYWVRLDWVGDGSLLLNGSIITSETTWDDGLPLRLDGRDIGGRYLGQNLELYWPDNQDDDQNGLADKYERILHDLTNGDYLIITSNRQYGTIPRVPQRYPFTSAYYQALAGCPDSLSISACYAFVEPGDYEGRLGYDLVAVFDSSPRLGDWVISDQLAEEAFTVYDHPRVLIFERAEDFSEEEVAAVLGEVDPFTAVHILPRDAGDPPPDLLLDAAQIDAQREAGTWSSLFNRDSLVNQSQLIAVVVWWLTIGLLGIAVFPLLQTMMPGLSTRAYPFARAAGLLLFAWLNWILGSIGLPVSRQTVMLVFVGLLLAGVATAWPRRREWLGTLKEQWKDLLLIEAAGLVLFIAFLLVRYGNPDLWHPAKGGEKPMDFSYFNAILRSQTFPPYDPWFAGGYINYYYYGFVLVGMPVKLLGLVPSLAYNLILPTIFSILALSAYGVGSLLGERLGSGKATSNAHRARLAGLTAALLFVVLGNLGTLRMFTEGFQEIGARPERTERGFVTNTVNGLRGLVSYITFQRDLPYGLEQWYWNPSRGITPGEGEAGPITEFPYFTLLYADLHAHLISRMVTMLALGWSLAWVLHARDRRLLPWRKHATALLFGGVVLGALPPTNTWDFPVYWLLGVLAVGYAEWLRSDKRDVWMALRALLSAGILLGAGRLLYLPYHQAYGQGYMNVDLWEGSLTNVKDYLYVFGLFLFLIISWLSVETWQWMKNTPASVLRRRAAVGYFGAGLLAIAATGLLVGMGYKVALIVVPLAFWDALLLLRRSISVERVVMHVLIGGALALTFLVELVVLRGDVSRMNTVFKFYLQAWEILSVAAGVGFAALLVRNHEWRRDIRAAWTAVAAFLFFSAALYPIMATPAKIDDRIARDAPHSLDGMAFMPYSSYYDMGQAASLAEDYDAILWMQDNIEGTPVIVEANIPEYRWGSRYSIYTGLPGVLGWNWHQRQQRVAAGDAGVTERALGITDFYMTNSVDQARAFLAKYNVEYVVVGMLEHMYFDRVQPCWPAGDGTMVSCDLSGWPMGMYAPAVSPSVCEPLNPDDEYSQLACPTYGLDKFRLMEEMGILRAVYEEGDTVIYQVGP